jgi:hypothetical protein
MKKRIIIYTIGIILFGILILYVIEKFLIAECPKYNFDNVNFEICTKYVSDNNKLKLLPIDTIYQNEKYIFLFDPIFNIDFDTTERLLNICIGPEEISYDSIKDIDIKLIHQNREYDLNNSLKKLLIDKSVLYNGVEITKNNDLLSFLNLYNELNNGYGDFYASLFELWAFEFKLKDTTELNGEVEITLIIHFSNSKTIVQSKKFYYN